MGYHLSFRFTYVIKGEFFNCTCFTSKQDHGRSWKCKEVCQTHLTSFDANNINVFFKDTTFYLFFKVYVFFFSDLYAQHGAQTHNPRLRVTGSSDRASQVPQY